MVYIYIILIVLVLSNFNDSLTVYFNQNNYLKVVEIADNSLSGNNKLTDQLYKKASESAMRLDELDKAIKFLKEAIKISDKKEYRDEWDKIVSMRKDIEISEYKKMEDLIDDYVYGSAIVVGYFLAYIYGPEEGYSVEDLLTPSKDLGIALQLTNFARDVYEDYFRGRFYAPTELLCKPTNKNDLESYVLNARKILATEAEKWYLKAENGMNYFASDSQIAIKTCLELFRKLNNKILLEEMPLDHRYSLSTKDKFSFLPLSKLWKLILLYF